MSHNILYRDTSITYFPPTPGLIGLILHMTWDTDTQTDTDTDKFNDNDYLDLVSHRSREICRPIENTKEACMIFSVCNEL